MKPLLILLAIVAVAAASTPAGAQTQASCTGKQLKGSFAVVRGSAGAGNITYKLVLKNVSQRVCTMTGLPQGRLLGKTGKALPTRVKAAFAPGLTAILVRLAPGKTTFATARFSPDVPGPGEPVAGKKCEPTSWFFRVVGQGGGTTTVKLAPSTPVCGHGRLLFSAYSVKS
jgi:hypothetical protein